MVHVAEGQRRYRLHSTDRTAHIEGQTFTYTMFDEVGMAKIVANDTADLPRTHMKGEEKTATIKNIGDWLNPNTTADQILADRPYYTNATKAVINIGATP